MSSFPPPAALTAAHAFRHAALANASPGAVKVGTVIHRDAAPLLSSKRSEPQDDGTFRLVQRMTFSVPKLDLATPYAQGTTAVDVATGYAFKIQSIAGEGVLLTNWTFTCYRQCGREETPSPE